MRKIYVKPELRIVYINIYSILAGSQKISISDTPATGPAQSKETSMFDDENDWD